MVTRAVRAAVEQGTGYDIEFRIIWPNGSVHWTSAAPAVHLPSWGGTHTDTRIAYLSGSALHVIGGQNYDAWLDGAEWNRWVRAGGWESYYPPEDAPRGKFRKIKVQVLLPAGMPKMQIYARGGYYVPQR